MKSALLPSRSEDDQLIPWSKKRQRLDTNGVSTDLNASEDDSEYCVVLETSKERFLVVRHGKTSQLASIGGANRVPSDKPVFAITLIQGEIDVAEGFLMSTTAPTTRSEDFTPVPEESSSSLSAPEQPTKDPSPIEPLPPVSTPREAKQVVQDSERGRSTSIVDMELDTPVSATPTATAGPDIPDEERTSLNWGELELGQGVIQKNTKSTAYGNKPQLEEKALPAQNVSTKVEASPLKPPSISAAGSEPAQAEVLRTVSVPAPRPEAQSLPQVQLKLQILQRNIRGDDLVFGEDGLGVLSADVDPLDNTKKGWLIEAPRWRRYNGQISDCIVVS